MKYIVTFREPVFTKGGPKISPADPIDAIVVNDYTISGDFLTCITTDHNRKMIIPLDNILGVCESFE